FLGFFQAAGLVKSDRLLEQFQSMCARYSALVDPQITQIEYRFVRVPSADIWRSCFSQKICVYLRNLRMRI
ncbi:MAG: hypothetical protein WCS65_12395, partial [Verrucomicrobiae bacterium]